MISLLSKGAETKQKIEYIEKVCNTCNNECTTHSLEFRQIKSGCHRFTYYFPQFGQFCTFLIVLKTCTEIDFELRNRYRWLIFSEIIFLFSFEFLNALLTKKIIFQYFFPNRKPIAWTFLWTGLVARWKLRAMKLVRNLFNTFLRTKQKLSPKSQHKSHFRNQLSVWYYRIANDVSFCHSKPSSRVFFSLQGCYINCFFCKPKYSVMKNASFVNT